jgi:hypothetical protein
MTAVDLLQHAERGLSHSSIQFRLLNNPSSWRARSAEAPRIAGNKLVSRRYPTEGESDLVPAAKIFKMTL